MRRVYFLLLALIPLQLMAQEMPVVASANKTFENITSIAVHGEFCKVDVSNGEQVSLVAELKAAKDLEGYAIDTQEAAGVLTIKVLKPESGWTSHTGFVNIKVPQGVKLNIQTTSGYINLSNINGAEMLAQSKSGKISADNLNGTITLRSKSASIKANNITGILNMKSKGGSQVVRQIKGDVSLYTSGGEMIVENIDGSLKTESTDGAQSIKEINGDVYLKTKSGAMKLSNAKGNIGSLSVSGTLNLFDVEGILQLVATKGSIIGNRVKLTESSNLQTTEGKIKLKFLNPKEELKFICESEHAYIIAYGKSKKKKLKMGEGPIVVTTISTTGAQNFNK
ncbi:MAG: hypothetical protein N4A71_09360 [Carboxylicivirga sp.]|jgi:hypothetical protein|nr:hypothetical protein [Carboxylicivirga sp.]